MDMGTWQNMVEMVGRLQSALDRPWCLEEMARVAGYSPHHFAHMFTDVVGISPVRFVRLMRLERAADMLVYERERTVLEVALCAGYNSGEAFTRAFRRAAGVSPRAYRQREQEGHYNLERTPEQSVQVPAQEFPVGLEPEPYIHRLGPLWGLAVRVPNFAPETFQKGLQVLWRRLPVDGPWQFGGAVQPWGWMGGVSRAFDLRVVRYTESVARGAEPPLECWRLPRAWYASFVYRGALDGLAVACEWIVKYWIPRSGLRYAFLPTLSQMGTAEPMHVRLHAPVRSLGVAF